MHNKPYLLVFLLSLFLTLSSVSTNSLAAQETYKSHKVQQGETVYSISKQYNISEESIYNLNPDARDGITENNILIIPASDTNMSVWDFKKHKVRRKETLFSIAKKYNITVDDIKKYNKHLYASNLKKGERLQIPVFKRSVSNENTTNNNSEVEISETEANTKLVHKVKAKETLYGIARQYGISIADLKKLNPNLAENLPIGTELVVPNAPVIESAVIAEEQYDFYEVQPKEGFYRLKVKLGLTQEEIVALNPYAKDGLKSGMILKIPREVSETIQLQGNTINLENAVVNKSTKRLAIVLPFQLNRIVSDSIDAEKDALKENRVLRISLDFYSGALLAMQFAKDQGIPVDASVFDSQGSSKQIGSLLSSKDFKNYDAVIGPLLSKNVEQVSNALKGNNVPVFSPLSNRNIKLTSNLFQTIPNDALLSTGMIHYIKENSAGKNMLLIADSNSKSKAKLLEAIPGFKTLQPREKGFLYITDIQGKIVKGQENWVVLESNDPVIVSNVIGILNGLISEEINIRLFTTDKNDSFDYDDISNMHLANLKFTFPSVSKNYDDDKEAFIVSYKNKYGVYPNRYAIRGFDLTYDVLLRLASEENFYDSIKSDEETEYIENKFRYNKKMFSGYVNEAYYILQYNPSLLFDVIK